MAKGLVLSLATFPVEEVNNLFIGVEDIFITVFHIATYVMLEWTVKVKTFLYLCN